MFHKKHRLKTLQVVDADGTPIEKPKPKPSRTPEHLASVHHPADALNDIDVQRVKSLPKNVMDYLDTRIGKVEYQAERMQKWAYFWRTMTVIMLIVAFCAAFYAYQQSQDVAQLARQLQKQDETLKNLLYR